MTGFSPRVRAVITERDGGCVMCGRGGPPTAIPVEHAQHGVCFLTDDGGITHQPPENR